jgi:NADH:ubiquinone oxidoreductase subunit 5 (subunit L)/multisubunit Na+/H+ antiporter MnhA subunit
LIAGMPVTAVAFLICAFSVMGIPPLGGFFSKYAVIAGAAATGHIWITLAYVATAVLTIIYLFRVFTMVFMGPPKTAEVPAEGSQLMVFSVALLAVLSVVSGIFITPSFGFAETAVQQMLGVIK